MKKILLFFLSALVIMNFFKINDAFSNTFIEAETDRPVYSIDADILTAYVSVESPNESIVVDVHIGIIDPSMDIYEYPDWNTNLNPIFKNLTLPANWDTPKIELFNLNISNEVPFGDGPGTYIMAVAIMKPGTLEIIDFSFAYFSVKSSSATSEKTGGVFLGYIKDYTNESNSAEVFTGAAFFDQMNEFVDIDVDLATIELDQCQINTWKTSLDTSFDLPTFLDAGQDLRISDFLLSKVEQNGITTYFNDKLQPIDYVENKEYLFIGKGGPDVGPFSTRVTAPPKLNLNEPDLSTSTTINRNSDLKLRWQSRPKSGGEIWVLISTSEFSFSNNETINYECQCRFKDDGQAIIPADKLSQLPATDASGPLFPGSGEFELPSFNSATINIYRSNWAAFTAQGLDYGIGAITTGITGDIVLQ